MKSVVKRPIVSSELDQQNWLELDKHWEGDFNKYTQCQLTMQRSTRLAFNTTLVPVQCNLFKDTPYRSHRFLSWYNPMPCIGVYCIVVFELSVFFCVSFACMYNSRNLCIAYAFAIQEYIQPLHG